jgi:hypothetical protein
MTTKYVLLTLLFTIPQWECLAATLPSKLCQRAIRSSVLKESNISGPGHAVLISGDDKSSEAVVFNLDTMQVHSRYWVSTERRKNHCKVTDLNDCGP